MRLMFLPGILVVAAVCIGADQPQWGQRYTRNQVSFETNLPASFDPETKKNVRWTAELGSETYATPIVANGKVLIGTNNHRPRDPRHSGDRGILLCLDEKSGGMLWQLVVPKMGPDPYLDWPGGGIVSPPSVEGDRCYLVTNRGEVVCLDLNGLADGNDGPFRDEAEHQTPSGRDLIELGKTDADIVWLYDLVGQAGIYPHDAGHSSILIHGDVLYVNTSNGVDNTHRKIRKPDAPSLVAIDKKTGRLLARDHEGMGARTVHCTWSSPAMGEVAGRNQVFFGGGDGCVYAFEPVASMPPEGQVDRLSLVWKFEMDPAAPKENVHRWMGNRRESASNIKSMPVFHEGRVYVTAGGDVWWGKRLSWMKCIDPGRQGDVTDTALIWSYEMPSHCCTTPAIHDGLAYVADSAHNLHCLDLKTGKNVWTHQLDGECWASALAADGKVYIGSRRGDFWVLAAGREKKVLHRIDLGSPISATATVANGVIYIATNHRLYAVAAIP